MKNNRSKIAAFKWKHLMAYKHLSMMYMLEHSKLIHIERNQSQRFDIAKFKHIVNGLFEASYGGEFPHSKRGSRAATTTRGAYLNYSNMKYEILRQAGVKVAKTQA